MIGVAILLLVACTCACGPTSTAGSEAPATGSGGGGSGSGGSAGGSGGAGGGSAPDGRHWIPDGFSGSPTACTVDADCTADTLPDVSSPCCNDPQTLEAYSVAWDQAVQRWRDASCGSVTCPPPPAPMLPERCRLTARCDSGSCRDSCP